MDSAKAGGSMSSSRTTSDAGTTTRGHRARAGSVRQVVEAFICLAVAVILFRAFEVEGYMISTGSMAPTLFGYHKRVECPSCGYVFAYGIHIDEREPGVLSSTRGEESRTPLPSREGLGEGRTHRVLQQSPYEKRGFEKPSSDASPLENDVAIESPADSAEGTATCPNCGKQRILTTAIPRNQGDQLLVHKNAFEFHRPRRWDPAVFRNPARPTQAYVKRIVGLPNEKVRIADGDVYADGRICRKSLALQRAVRIDVFDNEHQPHDDPEWQPRWVAESDRSGWQANGGGFEFSDQNPSTAGPNADSDLSWLRYRHWVREGGHHRTWVPLERREETIGLPDLNDTPLGFDPADGTLSCTGALSAEWRDRLLSRSSDPVYSRAVRRLYDESHIAPVTDTYGYNDESGRGKWAVTVRDLMVSLELSEVRGNGNFVLEMSDGRQAFRAAFDFRTADVQLYVDSEARPVRIGKFSMGEGGAISVEMSLFDKQVLVAVGGHEPFAPWEITATGEYPDAPRKPVRMGAGGVHLRAGSLKLFRDVYYTNKVTVEPPTLGPDEYFVLGDNSPVSFDSRSWDNPAVREELFLGKPILVHLPSRPGEFKLGGHTLQVRIPDLPRIRYIR